MGPNGATKYCNRVLNHLYSPVHNCLDIKKGEEID